MPKIESWELALTLIYFCETTLNRKKKSRQGIGNKWRGNKYKAAMDPQLCH